MELPPTQVQDWTITTGLTGQPWIDAWVAGRNLATILRWLGNIGTVLDKGFRFGSTGGYQKIKLTGSDGWSGLHLHYLQSIMGGKPYHESKLLGPSGSNLLLQPG